MSACDIFRARKQKFCKIFVTSVSGLGSFQRLLGSSGTSVSGIRGVAGRFFPEPLVAKIFFKKFFRVRDFSSQSPAIFAAAKIAASIFPFILLIFYFIFYFLYFSPFFSLHFSFFLIFHFLFYHYIMINLLVTDQEQDS